MADSEFPAVKHVWKNGKLFAEIEGRRYRLHMINGQWALSSTDTIDLINRYAPPDDKESLLAIVRKEMSPSDRLQ